VDDELADVDGGVGVDAAAAPDRTPQPEHELGWCDREEDEVVDGPARVHRLHLVMADDEKDRCPRLAGGGLNQAANVVGAAAGLGDEDIDAAGEARFLHFGEGHGLDVHAEGGEVLLENGAAFTVIKKSHAIHDMASIEADHGLTGRLWPYVMRS